MACAKVELGPSCELSWENRVFPSSWGLHKNQLQWASSGGNGWFLWLGVRREEGAGPGGTNQHMGVVEVISVFLELSQTTLCARENPLKMCLWGVIKLLLWCVFVGAVACGIERGK